MIFQEVLYLVKIITDIIFLFILKDLVDNPTSKYMIGIFHRGILLILTVIFLIIFWRLIKVASIINPNSKSDS